MKIEGRNAVREALKSGANIDKIMASKTSNDRVFNELIDMAKRKGTKVQFVDNDTLDNNSITKTHQGILAFTNDFEYSTVDDILDYANSVNQPPYILILDEIEDPHNLGSIIRVAEVMGVHGIIISKNRACPVNETVVRVSTGATSYVRVARVTNINREIEELKKQNVWVYAVEVGGESIYSSDLTGSIALVVGSEGKGMSPLTKKLCDGVVTIPMYGKINSLNASVATAVAVYETTKQRNTKK